VNIIIFSKNRPAQLELLLRSMKRFFKEYKTHTINVLLKADKCMDGYKKLIKMYPEVKYRIETDFKRDLLDLIDDKEFTAFDCDDDVFIREWSVEDFQFHQLRNTKEIMCLSMRMDHNYNFCLDCDRWMTVPIFDNNTWDWRVYSLDWGYPMSVLFNVFRTEEIKPLLEELDFKNPNTLEGAMASMPLHNPLMVGYERAKNINLPINLVQTVCKNKAGKIDTKDMNKRFLRGETIDLDNIVAKAKKSNSCFMIPDIKWITSSK
jgi:hypothetical protein